MELGPGYPADGDEPRAIGGELVAPVDAADVEAVEPSQYGYPDALEGGQYERAVRGLPPVAEIASPSEAGGRHSGQDSQPEAFDDSVVAPLEAPGGEVDDVGAVKPPAAPSARAHPAPVIQSGRPQAAQPAASPGTVTGQPVSYAAGPVSTPAQTTGASPATDSSVETERRADGGLRSTRTTATSAVQAGEHPDDDGELDGEVLVSPTTRNPVPGVRQEGPTERTRVTERPRGPGGGAEGLLGLMGVEVPQRLLAVPDMETALVVGGRGEVPPNAPLSLGSEASLSTEQGPAVSVLPREVGHIGAFGTSQYGKSTIARHIVRELVARGETVIAFTPAKGEEWYDVTAPLGLPAQVIDSNHPVSLNVLDPVPGYSRRSHLDLTFDTVAAFTSPGEEGANMYRQSMGEATNSLLQLHGLDPVTGEKLEGRRSPPTPFSEQELENAMLARVMKKYSFHPDNIAEYIRLRWGRLSQGALAPYVGRRGPAADILSLVTTPGFKQVNIGDMVTAEADVGLLMSLWLNSIWEASEVLANRPDADNSRRVTVVLEEAHRVGNNELMAAKMTQALQEWLGRGIRVLIINQGISELPDPWITNLGLVYAFRQSHINDQKAIGGILPFPETVRDERIANLANLNRGVAEVYMGNVLDWNDPMRLVTPYTDHKAVPKLSPERMALRGTPLAACGEICVSQVCENSVIMRAGRIASEENADIGAGRLWAKRLFDEMILGVGTSGAPDAFAERFRTLNEKDPRLADCLITEVVERMLSEHVEGVEKADIPRELIAATLATYMRTTLTGSDDPEAPRPGAPFDESFVPVQMRVLLAMEAIEPFEMKWHGHKLRDTDPAPPLRFPIPGVPETLWEKTYMGTMAQRPVTVAERREHLADCAGSMEKRGNRQVARGLILGDKQDDSRHARDLQLLFPRATWGQRHHLVDVLTHNVPEIRSGASTPRIAASWVGRFLSTRADEVKKKAPVKK